MTGDVIRRQTAALAAATTVGAGSGGNFTLPIDDGARARLVASMSLHDVREVHFPELTQLGLELLRRSVRLAAPGGEIKTESWNRDGRFAPMSADWTAAAKDFSGSIQDV